MESSRAASAPTAIPGGGALASSERGAPGQCLGALAGQGGQDAGLPLEVRQAPESTAKKAFDFNLTVD
eukprot:362014-Prorocentrum_minimum.AAC.1